MRNFIASWNPFHWVYSGDNIQIKGDNNQVIDSVQVTLPNSPAINNRIHFLFSLSQSTPPDDSPKSSLESQRLYRSAGPDQILSSISNSELNQRVDGEMRRSLGPRTPAIITKETKKIGHSFGPSKKKIKQQKKFNEALNKIVAEMQKTQELIKRLYQFKGSFKQLFTILSNNNELFLILLDFMLNKENFEIIKLNLSDKKEFVKFFEALFPIDYIEYYYSNKFKIKLANLGDEYKNFLLDDKENQKEFRELYYNISLEKKDTGKKCIVKFAEFFICKLTPLLIFSKTLTAYIPLIQDFNKKKLLKILKTCFKFLKAIKKLDKGHKANIKRIKWLENLKTQSINFEFTKDFQTFIDGQISPQSTHDLIELYQTQTKKSVYNTPEAIITRLKEEKEEFEKNVNIKISNFRELNKNKDCLDFVSFKQNLENNNFFSNHIKNISSMEEWNQKTSNEKFVKKICKDSVKHHMTIGKILQTSLKSMLLQKFKIEKLFLFFDSITCITDLFFNIIQCALMVTKATLALTYFGIQSCFKNSIKWLDKDIPFKEARLLFFLNPDIDISPFHVAVMTITHFFGYYHKPNEFSMKAYSITLQSRWVHIAYHFVYLHLAIVKISFKALNTFSESKLKKSVLNNNFFKSLENRIKIRKERCNNNIEILNKKMLELKKLDIKRVFNSHFSNDIKAYELLKKYLIENKCPQDLIKELNQQSRKNSLLDQKLNDKIDKFLESKFLYKRERILNGEINLKYTYDPLSVIIDSLNLADKLMFSKNVLHFFKNFTNITFEKNISKQVEKLFTNSSSSFFSLFDDSIKNDRSEMVL